MGSRLRGNKEGVRECRWGCAGDGRGRAPTSGRPYREMPWPGNKIPRLASLRSELRVGKGGFRALTRIGMGSVFGDLCITASERPHWEE